MSSKRGVTSEYGGTTDATRRTRSTDENENDWRYSRAPESESESVFSHFVSPNHASFSIEESRRREREKERVEERKQRSEKIRSNGWIGERREADGRNGRSIVDPYRRAVMEWNGMERLG